ncbi:MAG: hypothetical protein H6823_24610 [Planctomycetaceae bacterium]|nr:hypothetical protein [Planctomycetaceae bacterium]
MANTLPFQNPLRPLDTNRDGTVAPLDALIIITRLNAFGPGSLQTPIDAAGLTEYFYIDTNGDGSVAPVDVIQVINRLNNPSGQPEGEGTPPVVTLLRNVNSPPRVLNPQRDQAPTSGDAYGDWPRRVPVVRESALRSNATTRGTNLTGNDDEELVDAIDAFFTELEASGR